MKKISFVFLLVALVINACKDDDEDLEIKIQQIELAGIPAGEVLMGSDKGYEANEMPRATVILDSFLMSQYEVTQHQYYEVMNEMPGYFDCDNCPVEQVSWYDAIRFCNELSRREQLDTAYNITADTVIWKRSANGYRLPTEAEWEYACKAGTETDFYTGNLLYDDGVNVDPALDLAGWYSVNSGNKTQPVGKKQANAFGLYDLHGNVWEWCWDYFHDDRYMLMGNPADSPVDDKYSTERVIRGGSYFNNAFNARSALRYYAEPSMKNTAIGFRVVRNNP